MIKRFLEYLQIERRYSVLTVEAYRHDLEEFCRFLQCNADEFLPENATTEDVRAWMISMLDEGMSPRSVKRKLSSLRSFWKYLLRIGYTDTDITQRIIPPKTNKPLPVFYKEREMQQVLEEESWADDFSSVRDNLLIEMLYETGMRRQELRGLTDTDIDTHQRQIRVFGKRQKERIIPIGDHLIGLIGRYIACRDAVIPQENRENAFFLGPKGRQMSANAIYKVVHDRMSEVSTLKKQSPHVLRHTFATTMLNNGADINTIKELLGHANLAATQVYTHTTFEQLQRVYEQAHPRAQHNSGANK